MPFTLRRRQFPVRPAFAMTINKAQGKTLKMVGIFLPKPVFTHGQLYVAMSRIGCPEGVKLLVTNGWKDAHEDAPAGVYTRNVVYTEVFNMIVQTKLEILTFPFLTLRIFLISNILKLQCLSVLQGRV
jgi:ATP-dependent DNA helicase PIF1